MTEYTVSLKSAKEAFEYNEKQAAARARTEKKLKDGEFLGYGRWMVAIIHNTSITFEAADQHTIFTSGTERSIYDVLNDDGTPKKTYYDVEEDETHTLNWV